MVLPGKILQANHMVHGVYGAVGWVGMALLDDVYRGARQIRYRYRPCSIFWCKVDPIFETPIGRS
jgi:hypothetical protein